jgi:acetyl esterase/lipase
MVDLNDAYANLPYIEGGADFPPRWAATADRFRKRLGERAELGISYGPSERQAYDLFHPEGAPKGTLIFVHGGYWLKFDRSYWSHFAKGALEQGWAVAMPSYDLCPQVHIAGITQQIAQAVQTIAANVSDGVGPMSLAGHSAGGHLAARMLAPGMLPQKVVERIQCVMPISPVSDLEPLCQLDMNADFKLDLAMARAESPLRQPPPTTKVSLWVGAEERPVFLDQAMWLGDAWQCDLTIVPKRHHFDIIDDLIEPESKMIAQLTAS